MMEQPHYPPQPLVGQNMAFNPISPPPASAYRTPSPQATNKTVHNVIDDDNNDANKTVFVKRYWTHEEEERLVSYDHFNNLVGHCLVQNFICLYFVIIGFVGQFLVGSF
jgi:hypothetical protein